LPLGTEEDVAGDPTGVMVERSESETRRPDGEARNEPTRRVTVRAGASQRAIDDGWGGDMMTNPSRSPNAPERWTGDSMSSGRRCCSDGHPIEATLDEAALAGRYLIVDEHETRQSGDSGLHWTDSKRRAEY
jgi:hypothetical protein